jgi:GT2 family glycosyltransferase
MKLTVALPVMNQLEDTKGIWGSLICNTFLKNEVEILVINNGSTDGTKEFIEKFVSPHFPDHRIIDNPENIGVLASMQQIVDNAKGDVIAILHNDLYILEGSWDVHVLTQFEQKPKLGLAGFLGAEGIGSNGGRINTHSNMLEAELHGFRTTHPKQVSHFDGLALIGRKEMFKDVGGFDQKYTYHHFYDRDISLASHYAGWENWMLPVFCHHRSGVTANRPDYQAWIAGKMEKPVGQGDLASYQASERYFFEKWRGKIPLWIQ